MRFVYLGVHKTDQRRRGFLKIIGTGAAVGFGAVLTGCLGGGTGSDGEEPEDGTREDSGSGNDSDVEPVSFPEDSECAVCSMMAAEYPDWNAQVVHDDEARAYLCTSGCMTAYKAYPAEFAVTDTGIEGVWVTDFETRELIDGEEAHYALETDPERVDDPMMTNPAPFEERVDAVAYVDEVEYLTEDDIVGYADLGAETARMYRGQLVPEGGSS